MDEEREWYALPAGLEGECPTTLEGLLGRLSYAGLEEAEELTLRRLWAERPEWAAEWLREALPEVWALQRRLSSVFPGGRLRRLPAGRSGSLSLSRLQTAALLSHMLLGTTRPDAHIRFYANFEPWMRSSKRLAEDPRVAYLASLLDYFRRFRGWGEAEREEQITFHRHHASREELGGWRDAVVEPDRVEFPDEGSIGDRPGLETEMDFANACVGFGATGTQEEIMFGCSPELCVAPLLLPRLLDSEVALIRGAHKVSDAHGYGDRVTFTPRPALDPVASRWVLCADAMDLSDVPEEERAELLKTPKRYASLVSEEGVWARQTSAVALEREAGKLFLAFRSAPAGLAIGTGKWGCGAFGGSALLKGFLQVAVASAARRRLRFYTFRDKDIARDLRQLLHRTHGLPIPQAIPIAVAAAKPPTL